ncbi:MAG TPA: cbb3-type cytochrome c oxidase subunit II, partial [Opitutaceae bacterium]
DSQRWGPAAPLKSALSGTPPLVGTRRQGPDLANVGNRRSAGWQKLHLMDPQAISPGSRMPAYAHLFKPGDGRGDALVAYLLSLGAETRAARDAQIAAWRPDTQSPLSPAESARRFQQLCAQCHGATGRGDGALASNLTYRPPDWSLGVWHQVPPGADVELALSRIIKFGIAGLPMAGHEYLPDRDVVGLARHVQTLHATPSPPSTVAAQP